MRLAVSVALLVLIVVPPLGWANHPVLVEGNCDSPVPGTTLVSPGTCGDFDGDGRIGTAEDTDGADRIFGTINAAIGPGTGAAAGTGANNNGTITIVGSGRYAEVIGIGGSTGNVTLEAAPGVNADIDAVLQGDPAGGNATRQNAVGITVNAAGDRRMTLRNLTIRNFLVGIQVLGDAHLTIEDCRLENNVNFGIEVLGPTRVLIHRTTVRATGHRVSTGNFPTGNAPAPGAGVSFNQQASGIVSNSTISGNFAAGLENNTGVPAAVCAIDVVGFDNGVNFLNVDPVACAGVADVCSVPACPAPVVEIAASIQECKKCKTRGEVTTCTKCTVAVQ